MVDFLKENRLEKSTFCLTGIMVFCEVYAPLHNGVQLRALLKLLGTIL